MPRLVASLLVCSSLVLVLPAAATVTQPNGATVPGFAGGQKDGITVSAAADNVNGATREWTFNNFSFVNGQAIFAGDVGAVLYVTGATNPANNGYHYIEAVTGTHTIRTGAGTAPVTETFGSGVTARRDREIGLDVLFGQLGDPVNWQTHALSAPSTFSPMCGFSATLIRNDSSCTTALYWYNVIDGRTTPPVKPPSPDPVNGNHLYPLLPSTFAIGQTKDASAVLSDPNYLGGLIGFAVADCSEIHYSEPKWNRLCTGCTPPANWIMSLIYQSQLDPNTYYVTFEDGTTGTGTNGYNNDGDYNDKVFKITGISCSGGGTPCITPYQGVCAEGMNQCSGANLQCTAKITPGSQLETCDGLDNDCDGQVDEGTLCPANQVCDRGSCVPYCIEQGCPTGQMCAGTGLCVESACETMTCDAGTRCKTVGGVGTCVNPCDGIVCPHGQECRAGRCFDRCAGVTCGSGYVCVDGVCDRNCSCKKCSSGTSCATNGLCVVTPCLTVTCPAGQHCVASGGTGSCVDNCTGSVCPAGQACVSGSCVDPCLNVTCGAGLRCCPAGRSCSGTCVDACDPRVVTCGTGQTCLSGSCVDACQVVTCPTGQFCKQGDCIDACNVITCPGGEACVAGQCQDACIGVTCGAGQKCSAGSCVDACQGVTCPPNEKCSGGRCVDICQGVDCSASTRCLGGSCVDPCATITCPIGQTCIGGACIDTCSMVSCSLDQKCVSGLCVDACQGVTCPNGQICVRGSCGSSCTGVQCNLGEVCSSGACIDACQAITCDASQKCVSGICVDACTGITCAAGFVCKSGSCIDACQGVSCPPALKCQGGACVDRCTGVTCGSGETCVDGACQDACLTLTCPAGRKCVGGACVDACQGVTCTGGMVCVAGSCTSSPDGGTGPDGSTGADGGTDAPADVPVDVAAGDAPGDMVAFDATKPPADAAPTDAAPADVGADRPTVVDPPGACSCNTASRGGSLATLLLLMAAGFMRRRRR